MGSDQNHNQHILMLPFMAQGHLIPFLGLAHQIHDRTGFKITIATTPLNIKYLHKTISQTNNDTTAINLSELPFSSSDHNLPPNTENTESLSLNQIINLFNASRTLQTPTRDLIFKITEEDGCPPLCIISDIFLGWATDVARECTTTNISFTTCGAYGTAAYISVWLNLPHRNGEDEFSLPGFSDRVRFHVSQLHRYLKDADGTDIWSKFFQPQIRKSMESGGWLCNTVEEIEPQSSEILRNILKLPVWTIGPLLPPSMLNQSTKASSVLVSQRGGREFGTSPVKLLSWLDTQTENSVLYISFGSQNSISPTQMMELAIGLEESGKPFIWVIRPPAGFHVRGEFRSEWLPDGFEERMAKSNIGLLVHQWAPQLEILAHKSTGAFLSHCGWNSVLESLSQGVPILGWPLAAEQAYNSKMLVEEMGVSLELTRGVDGKVVREDVKEIIDLVMGKSGKGIDIRKKAGLIGEHIKAAVKEEGGRHKGSSIKALDQFVADILSKR